MPDSPRNINHLLIDTGGFPVTAKVHIDGLITRRLGIWPDSLTCFITEDELANFPLNKQDATIDLKVGTDLDNITIRNWRVMDVEVSDIGSTDGNATVRPVTFRLKLEDGRWQLQGDRGGVLLDGLINPTLPDGTINPDLRKENADLVQMCLDAMPMTHREGVLQPNIIASLNAYDPPADLEWYGAHAPTELQRLLEHTRHVFAMNQDGTYSIRKLVDPGQALALPDIDVQFKRPSLNYTIKPRTPFRCIIASCPTRSLVQRRRTLESPRPLAWVGVDVDGSIKKLEDLSWWPSGKTPIDVVKRNYADVSIDHRSLAQRSIFKMLRLSDEDLDERWSLARRLVDDFELSDFNGSKIRQPLTCLLKARIARPDKHNMYLNTDTLVPIEGVSIDLETGVINSPEMLVKVTGRTPSPYHLKAVEITSDTDLEFHFAHYPNGGLLPGMTRYFEDYFMALYEWDLNNGAKEITGEANLLLALADSANVPIYRFDALQLMYRERTDGTMFVDPVNESEIKAVALKIAKAIVTDQHAQVQTQEYTGLHDVDPTGSISVVAWDASDFVTMVRLADHVRIDSDYAQMIAIDRASKGGAATSAPIAQTRGMLTGRTGSTGPASGNRAITRQAVPPLPGGGSGSGSSTVREFVGLVQSYQSDGDNKWLYTIREIVKTDEGAGASAWENPADYVEVQARNLFELFNSNTGMLGIGVSVAELDACAVQLRPIQPGNPPVQVREEIVHKSDGSVVSEYLFAVPNGIEDKP